MKKMNLYFSVFFIALFFLAPLVSQATALTKPANNLGLVGYWSFNEATGTAATDFSGNGNTGTLTNGPTWTSGKLGSALNFVNSGGTYVYVPYKSSLNTPNAVTVSAWVKTASANREDIISRYQASAPYNGYALVIAPGFGCGSSGQVGLWFGNGSTYECSSQTVNDGEWHFLAGTYDGTTAKVYIDGAQVASDPQTGNLNETAQNLKIGQESISSGFTADAQIDEARVYNRALGAAEILALYKSGQTRINSSSRNIVSGGLIGWWTFDGANTTDKIYDQSGQGNNGYLHNNATSTAKVVGKIGQAFRFDGIDDYVDVGSSVPFDSSNWTLSLWVDASDVNGSFQRLLSYYNNGPTIWKNSGSGALSIVHGGTADFDMGITLTNNSWTHIVVTRQGSTITAYKDGMQTAQNASFSVTFTNDTSVRMGQATSFDNPYSGSLDDVRIYNRAITAQEVKNLYGMGASKIGGSQANIPGSTLNSGLVGTGPSTARISRIRSTIGAGRGTTDIFTALRLRAPRLQARWAKGFCSTVLPAMRASRHSRAAQIR